MGTQRENLNTQYARVIHHLYDKRTHYAHNEFTSRQLSEAANIKPNSLGPILIHLKSIGFIVRQRRHKLTDYYVLADANGSKTELQWTKAYREESADYDRSKQQRLRDKAKAELEAEAQQEQLEAAREAWKAEAEAQEQREQAAAALTQMDERKHLHEAEAENLQQSSMIEITMTINLPSRGRPIVLQESEARELYVVLKQQFEPAPAPQWRGREAAARGEGPLEPPLLNQRR